MPIFQESKPTLRQSVFWAHFRTQAVYLLFFWVFAESKIFSKLLSRPVNVECHNLIYQRPGISSMNTINEHDHWLQYTSGYTGCHARSSSWICCWLHMLNVVADHNPITLIYKIYSWQFLCVSLRLRNVFDHFGNPKTKWFLK